MVETTRTTRFRFWLWLIRVIGVLVPRRLRADWRQEWEAELCYREVMLAEWDRLDGRSKLDLLRRSTSAFWDALLLQPSRLEDEMFQDLRFGVRMLLKKPGFTLIAVLTLALGIGANTAIFSVVNAVLLRPLPYPESDRLVKFWLSAPDKGLPVVDLPEGLFAYFRDRTRTLEKMAAYRKPGFSLTGVGEAERLQGANVTHDFFSILGAQPLHGRTFLPEESTPGKNLVTILSYELWQRRFNGDPAIVGKSVNLNNIATAVVGIMPPGFVFPSKTELWIPVGLNPQNMNCWCYDAIGRLKPGFTTEDVQREIAALSDDFSRERDPQAKGGSIAVAKPLLQTIVGEVRTPLLLLLCATALVLLIACANIANLLLTRATTRSREIAVRCCLGAGRGRVVRQLLMESLLLALVGAGCGLLVGWWGLYGLKLLPVEDLPRLEGAQIDPSVLLFTLGVTILTGLLFGLAPALRGAGVNLQQALKEGARGTVAASSRRLNHTFVVAQIALSLVLLIGAALLLQSFQRLLAVDPGFRAENVLTARVSLPSRKYAEPSKVNNFYQQLLEGVRRLPGVQAAGLNVDLPFNPGDWQDEFIVQGQEPALGEPIPVASIRSASPGYLETLKIPVLSGRTFQESDTESAPPVAIVDEKLARKYWPNGNAIGQRIRRGNLNSAAANPWLTIVGIVASVKHASLDEVTSFYLYRPFAQNVQRSIGLVIRTSGDPLAMTRAVRAQVMALDADLPLHSVNTMEQAVARSLSTRQLTRLLLTGFAMTALLLASLGIYGVMSLHVSSRTGEFGIRRALGAQTGDVLWLVVRQGTLLALTGTSLGLAAAFALTRLMKKLLFGVSPTDPLTFALIAALLTAVAVFACYWPARRATKIDPLAALRHE